MAYSKEDWNAAMSSEVFREYLKGELHKEAAPQPPPVDKSQVLGEFADFEQKVRSNPKLKLAFQTLQAKFRTDPEYTAKVDPQFVKGVMLLNLSDAQE
jgi:hypothetical protein